MTVVHIMASESSAEASISNETSISPSSSSVSPSSAASLSTLLSESSSGVFCVNFHLIFIADGKPKALMKWYAARCMEWSMHLKVVSTVEYFTMNYKYLQNSDLFGLKLSLLWIELFTHGPYSNIICADAITNHPPKLPPNQHEK